VSPAKQPSSPTPVKLSWSEPFESGEVQSTLRNIAVSGSGQARMIDAGHRGLTLLEARPASRARILVLIGQPMDYIAQGKIKPVVMAAPLGYGTTGDISRLYNDKPLQLEHLARYTEMLLNEVMPRVEADFNIGRQQKDRAIAGLSMGGAQTMSIGLGHPERFAYVGGISPALVMLDTNLAKAYPALDPRMNSQYKLVYFSCGTEDGLMDGSIALKSYLDGKGVKSEFVRMPGRHVWQVFRRSFAAFALRLFQ